MAIQIRRATFDDVESCGRICYEAFSAINREHRFPPEIPAREAAVGMCGFLFAHSGFYCVVAEADGRIIGSNSLDERSTIAGIGPITIDPAAQNQGAGRLLMLAVMDRARERNFPGVRLLQSAFHNRSLSLYAKLGFAAREPMSVMQGPPIKRAIDGCRVRPAHPDDAGALNSLCECVHGHNRSGELIEAIEHGAVTVVERHGRITGYDTGFGYFSHAVGESNLDLQALMAAADSFGQPGTIVPTRNAELFRWCLENGLRIVQPMTLMTVGLYNEPAGAYLPSILY